MARSDVIKVVADVNEIIIINFEVELLANNQSLLASDIFITNNNLLYEFV